MNEVWKHGLAICEPGGNSTKAPSFDEIKPEDRSPHDGFYFQWPLEKSNNLTKYLYISVSLTPRDILMLTPASRRCVLRRGG